MMNFKTFIKRLEEARDFSRIENAYSHIVYDIFNLTLDTSKYVLIDTSTYKRNENKQDSLVPNDAIAVPDFVIGNRADKIDGVNRLGCIEVKYFASDIENADQLSPSNDRLENHYTEGKDRRGYLSLYHNFIYTNGWKWRIFVNKKSCSIEFDFTKEENQTNEYYGIFLAELFQFDWNSLGSGNVE